MQQQPPPYGQQPGYPPQGYAQPPKKGTSPIVIVLAVLGGLVVLMFGSCAICVGIGAKGVHDANEKQKKVEATSKANAEKVDVATLLSAYKGNEVKADNTYKGKYFEVRGVVDEVKKDFADDTYVTIGTGQGVRVARRPVLRRQGGRRVRLEQGRSRDREGSRRRSRDERADERVRDQRVIYLVGGGRCCSRRSA